MPSKVFLNHASMCFLLSLLVNCWPNENEGQCEVTIEYELQLTGIELNDVTISVPVP